MKTQNKEQATETTKCAISRVLLVDESRLQRRILSASLTRDGFEVIEAGSSQEAIDICSEQMPDLILCDWMLSGLSGPEFCHRLRDMSPDRYVYFIYLTAKSEREDVVQGLEQGGDDFLIKPIDSAELRARISAGERILRMQRELSEKHRIITETLTELQHAHTLLDNDLIEARRLQQSLVRNRYLEFETAAVSLMLHSSGHVGGDLVGHYAIDDDRIGLFAFDVSGHGVSSALMTARLAGYLSASLPDQNVALQRQADGSYDHLPPAEVVAHLNDRFLDEIETEHYFTMVLAEVHWKSGRVLLTQAGHPHPVVLRKDGSVTHQGQGGLPVGLIPNATYSQQELQLRPGDSLLILSDGVTECENPRGEMLGEVGLTQTLQRAAPHQGEAFLSDLVSHLRDFAGAKGFQDDVSGILLEFGRA